MSNDIMIVQGAQWGSEGKGGIAAWLAVHEGVQFAVRTGSINAGHTVYYRGVPYAMQQLPTAWVNPGTKLVIGPGAYVHYPTLKRELRWIREATMEDPSLRVIIDWRAGVHLDSYAEESADVNRHHLIGATGKGCAEAIVHKIKDRGTGQDLLFANWCHNEGIPIEWQWGDVPLLLTRGYQGGAKILLEGTQGEDLDFHLGPWPYVTSRQTTASAWVTEAGLSPALRYEVILVARTYPIRVAGNSGPMTDEISWPILARQINLHLDSRNIGEHPMRTPEDAISVYVAAVEEIGRAAGVSDLNLCHTWDARTRVKYRSLLSEYAKQALVLVGQRYPDRLTALMRLFETTTVTKKLRRIARLDQQQLHLTIERLRPSTVVMGFLNYEFPEMYGMSVGGEFSSLKNFAYTRQWARRLIDTGDIHPRIAVSTGPLPEHYSWL